MAVDLLDFVRKALRVAKQPLGNHAGKPGSSGLPREAHIVAHCNHKEEDHTFTELVDRLGLMPDACTLLGIHPEIYERRDIIDDERVLPVQTDVTDEDSVREIIDK